MNLNSLPFLDSEKKNMILCMDSLAFDDASVHGKSQAEAFNESTPVNAIARWQRGDWSNDVAFAVASLYLRGEVKLNNETFEAVWNSLQQASKQCFQTSDDVYVSYVDALSKLAEGRSDYHGAESYLREMIRVLLKRCSPDHVDVLRAQLRLGSLLKKLNRIQEAAALSDNAQFKLLLLEQRSNQQLREAALTSILEGDYGKAKLIYQYLANNGFELASTYCHFARLCFILMDFEAMCDYAEQALKNYNDSDAYVKPRILFFILVGKILMKQPWDDVLREIDNALQKPNVNMSWTMLPILEKHRELFASADFTMLVALIEAMSMGDKMKDLFVLPQWCEVVKTTLKTGQL